MGFTTTQLEAIESAIASGQLKVAFNGREVVYRSMSDLIAARNAIKADLQKSGAIPKRIRFSYISRRMD